SRGLGHRPFTAATGVRIPLGTPLQRFEIRRFYGAPGPGRPWATYCVSFSTLSGALRSRSRWVPGGNPSSRRHRTPCLAWHTGQFPHVALCSAASSTSWSAPVNATLHGPTLLGAAMQNLCQQLERLV